MSRLAALLTLTAAFAPAAVLGALPLVAPVVLLLTAAMLLMAGPEAAAAPVEPTVTERTGGAAR